MVRDLVVVNPGSSTNPIVQGIANKIMDWSEIRERGEHIVTHEMLFRKKSRLLRRIASGGLGFVLVPTSMFIYVDAATTDPKFLQVWTLQDVDEETLNFTEMK